MAPDITDLVVIGAGHAVDNMVDIVVVMYLNVYTYC